MDTRPRSKPPSRTLHAQKYFFIEIAFSARALKRNIEYQKRRTGRQEQKARSKFESGCDDDWLLQPPDIRRVHLGQTVEASLLTKKFFGLSLPYCYPSPSTENLSAKTPLASSVVRMHVKRTHYVDWRFRTALVLDQCNHLLYPGRQFAYARWQ